MMKQTLMQIVNTRRIAILGVALLSCLRAHADVTLDEVHRTDLGGALAIEARTTTAISGTKARIEARQTISSPLSSVPEEGSTTTVHIVRGDRGKQYTYVAGTSWYRAGDLQGKTPSGPAGGAERVVASCSTPKVTVSSHTATAIAGLATNEARVRVTQECKDPESARTCTAVLTARRWMAAEVPFAKDRAALSQLIRPELGGLYPSPDAPDPLVEQARQSLRTLLNAWLDVRLWDALESQAKTLRGVAVKSTLELAALPCYPLSGGAPDRASSDEPQFLNMMLGMLSGAVLMEWSQQNQEATQPVALFMQSSELLAIRPDAIDASQFEVPAQLTQEPSGDSPRPRARAR